MPLGIFDLFKIGIGPSSSHTVGPMVAAKRFVDAIPAKQLSGITSIKAEMFGSLGATGVGHGTVDAVVLGLLGEEPETVAVDEIASMISDIQAKQIISLPGGHVISFNINNDIILHQDKCLAFHANGMRFSAYQNQQVFFEKEYFSVGGGFIVEGSQTQETGKATPTVCRQPFHFANAKELLAICDQHKISIAEIMYANEVHKAEAKQLSKQDVDQKIEDIWQVMQACVERGLTQTGVLSGGLHVKRRAKEIYLQLQHKNNRDPLEVLDWVSVYALAVNEENASGGRVVTAPTNGAAGIIPAVLHYYMKYIEGANIAGVKTFLLTAAAIGILFKKNASISGAEVGCQGEVGSACSMAAAGLAAVSGGTPQQIENAAEIAMEHHLGLTCDPIGGLVQVPCIERNAVASVKAIHAVRMALKNDSSGVVSLDEVINTMRETGKDMLEKYKETSRGGLATHVAAVPVNIVEC